MTLLELIVAVAIFAIMSAMLYGGLQAVTTQLQAGREAEASLRQLQYAMRRISIDMAQLNPRPVRDALGDNLTPAIVSGGGEFALEFTTGGWRNPLRQPRSTLQRVAYSIDGDKLVRLHWPVLDRVLASEPLRLDLVENVGQMRVRFMDQQGEWHEQWPPLSAAPAQGDPGRERPRAVDIELELDEWGVVRRVIEVAT